MTDLAVLVPSRGRPANVARLVEACEKTCRIEAQLIFGFDDDDPMLSENLAAVENCKAVAFTEPRMGLAAWTNRLAAISELYVEAPYLASLGDDMVPITDGWDEQLIAALDSGPGFAYPEDRRRSDIPEACVISTPIVAALGWMCLPALDHWYVDNVWADLGNGAGCLHYLPDVIVEHRHPNVCPDAKPDATYAAAAARFDADAAAYRRWRLFQMPKDIATVRACLNRPA